MLSVLQLIILLRSSNFSKRVLQFTKDVWNTILLRYPNSGRFLIASSFMSGWQIGIDCLVPCMQLKRYNTYVIPPTWPHDFFDGIQLLMWFVMFKPWLLSNDITVDDPSPSLVMILFTKESVSLCMRCISQILIRCGNWRISFDSCGIQIGIDLLRESKTF